MTDRVVLRSEVSWVAEWQITRITGKGAIYVGKVQAADAAIRLAIREYDIEPQHQDRVAADRS